MFHKRHRFKKSGRSGFRGSGGGGDYYYE